MLKRQLTSFIVIGISVTLLDFIIYELLSSIISYVLAKTISFITGSITAYLLNKFFTFRQPSHSTAESIRFAALYTLTLVVNVSVNQLCLTVLPQIGRLAESWQIVVIMAFIVATGFSTVLNFIGQKLWVFVKVEDNK